MHETETCLWSGEFPSPGTFLFTTSSCGQYHTLAFLYASLMTCWAGVSGTVLVICTRVISRYGLYG